MVTQLEQRAIHFDCPPNAQGILSIETHYDTRALGYKIRVAPSESVPQEAFVRLMDRIYDRVFSRAMTPVVPHAKCHAYGSALRIAPRPADRFADGVYEIRGIDAENLDAALAATVQGLHDGFELREGARGIPKPLLSSEQTRVALERLDVHGFVGKLTQSRPRC